VHKLRFLLVPAQNPNGGASANSVLSALLPRRTRFHSSLDEFLFDDSYSIEVDWEERIATNRERLCGVLGVAELREKWKVRQLQHLFDRALDRTKKRLRLNPRLAVAQGFVDSKHRKFRMELLLPLRIEYPKFSNRFFLFALAMSKSTEQTLTYSAKSILTADMAYNNARLVGYVDSSWLRPPNAMAMRKSIQSLNVSGALKANVNVKGVPLQNTAERERARARAREEADARRRTRERERVLQQQQQPRFEVNSTYPMYSAKNNYVLY